MPTGPAIRTRRVMGTPVSVTDYVGARARASTLIDAAAAGGGERSYFCHVSAHGLVEARRNDQLAAAYEAADLVLPDGMPVVWALRRLGERIDDRVYGPTMMETTCEWAAETGARVWLFGGHDESALAKLREALDSRFPGLNVTGSHSPPHRELLAEEEGELAGRINADAPDIVWVGIGTPRQEIWMHRMRPLLDAPVLSGVGAAFDFLAGLKPQAPAWMQRRGLEWAYRAASEPRRLVPRYARTNPRFIAGVSAQLARERLLNR